MTVDTVVYDENGHGARDDPVDARDDAGTTWVRVVDPTDAELDEIAAGY